MAEPNFEKDLEKLEKIVEELEEGGLSLEQSLKRFEDGVKLSRRCEKALSSAEKRIEILLKNAEGELEPQPFGDDAGGGGDDAGDDDEDDDEDGELLF